jgi:hypothetical protein
MDMKIIIQGQFLAAIEMLKQAVTRCPEGLWSDQSYKNEFWHIAYHALFYTHLYLEKSARDFVPWGKHRPGYERMERTDQPYSQEEVLTYCEIVREQIVKETAAVDLEAESGFSWLHFNKLEVQFYNIRHLQQHVGELCERLGVTNDIEIDWVASRPE